MKVTLIFASTIISAFILFACQSPKKESKIDLRIVNFNNARKAGDLKMMYNAVQELEKANIIKIGMTINEFCDILGEPDSGTGIYVMGGVSIGYGKGIPGTDYTFCWFDFRKPDWRQKEPKEQAVLLGWHCAGID